MKLIGLVILSLVSVQPMYGQSQAEMNIDASRLLADSESRLHQSILTITKLYKSDGQFLRCVEESQQAWLVYREKQMAMFFPKRDEPRAYGTVFPLCWSTWKKKLTDQRIAELQIWIEGIQEGDVCTGSIRVR